jgi:hypothetical protein
MKKIKLTQNKYTLVDDEDYDYLNQWNWHCSNNNYAVRTDNKLKKTIYMHRVIINSPDKLSTDHINGNGLDNRKENLRVCTQTQNNGNRKLNKNSTSGIKGISWNKINKKWKARISTKGKRKHLGYFKNKNDAKKAYTKVAKNYFGEFYSDGVIK